MGSIDDADRNRMRVTIQYGPWAPDLADVPLQYQDQPGPITVPVADCLNVYYANGTYKSTPSPLSATINGNTTAALPAQCLGAISYFDSIIQQKSVFAGAASAVYQLNPDGTWSSVNFASPSSSWIGLSAVTSWSFCELGPYVIGIPFTAQSAGAYLWSNQGSQGVGNSFSQPANCPGGRLGAVAAQFLMLGNILQSQQQAIGTGDGTTTTFQGSLANTPMLSSGSVYQGGNLVGTFVNGLISGATLATPALPGGGALKALADVVESFSPNTSTLEVYSAHDPGQNAFTTVTANSVTLQASQAAYVYSNGVANWVWNTSVGAPFGFSAGNPYPISFTGGAFQAAIEAGAGTITLGGGGGTITTTGYQAPSAGVAAVGSLIQSNINYETGAILLLFTVPPPLGNVIYVNYTQAALYRVQWSAIGDPTNWPVPLTANAIAFQSGYQDMEADLGPVMFISGQPLFAIIFQLTGISRANYVGGDVVFSFATYSRNRGLVSSGAAVTVGTLAYFLSQDGFFVTDGNSVTSIGTDQQNNAGIDNWFWQNVNQNALGTISCAYDDTSRCVYWAVPTGSNALPDTLLAYNSIAARWTRSAVPVELLFTDDNGGASAGTELRLGLFQQSHQYSSLLGIPATGYLESCDLMPVDGMYRITTGVRPNVACTDVPRVTTGTRNSMQDVISYTGPTTPDPFSRSAGLICNGLYTRVRVSSASASAINGATMDQQNGGSV